MEDRIDYIEKVRREIQDAANKIIEQRMPEYANRFDWNPKVDGWLWHEAEDISFVVTCNIVNVTVARYKTKSKEP